MSLIQYLAFSLGGAELLYIFFSNVFQKDALNWKLSAFLLCIALYNLNFIHSDSSSIYNSLLSVAASFLYLDISLSKMRFYENRGYISYALISIIVSIGFLIAYAFTYSYSVGFVYVAPFILVQNFFLFSVVRITTLDDFSDKSQVKSLFTNLLLTVVLCSTFLLESKQFAALLCSNFFFVFSVAIRVAEQRKERERILDTKKEKEKFQTLDDLFMHWNLSESEIEISLLLIKGMNSDEIAFARGIDESTVRKHVSNITLKAGVKKNEHGVRKREDFIDLVTSYKFDSIID